MCILQDERDQVTANKEYLRQDISKHLITQYRSLQIHYERVIEMQALNPTDPTEVNQILKDKLRTILKEKESYYSVSVQQNNFVLTPSEIYDSPPYKSLVSMTFPPLEIRLKDGWPKEYLIFKQRLKNSLEINYLRHLYQQFGSLTTSSMAEKQTDFKPNLDVFKNALSHQFFNHLYKEWLCDIDQPRAQLSCIVNNMKDSGGCTSSRTTDFEIIGTKKKFAEFWNALEHTYKIKIDDGSKVRLNDTSTEANNTQYNQRRETFLNKLKANK